MIYEHFFQKNGDQSIRAGLIGTGTYGMSLFSQAQLIPRLEIPVLCDRNIEALRYACRQAEISEENISLCNSRKAILKAMEDKKWAITQEPDLLMDLPLDVIVECTGNPEAGARNAELAINHGKHVAMVNKETDSVIGPILHYRAKQSNVVYTPVDGDQHGLLMGLTSWARNLGIDVICGGKAHAHEFIYNEDKNKINDSLTDITLTGQDMELFRELKTNEVHGTIKARRKILKNLSHISMADMCESVIAANATGLMPDMPELHGPIVRITEIPDVLCPQRAGGILSKQRTIDVVICLRRTDEAGLAGGVFIVVACENNDAWEFLKRKGILVNRQGTYGLIYRPYHLLGIETPISILCAGLLNLSTGSTVIEPRVDLVARATMDLKAGSIVDVAEKNTDPIVEPLILPTALLEPDNPLPLYLAAGNRLKVDVASGTILTSAMIEPPSESRLRILRREQDRVFSMVK